MVIVMNVTMIMIFSEPVAGRNPWLTLNHSMDLKVTNQPGADDDNNGDDDDDGDGVVMVVVLIMLVYDNRSIDKIFCALFSMMGDHFLVLDINTTTSKWNHGIGPITMNPNNHMSWKY